MDELGRVVERARGGDEAAAEALVREARRRGDAALEALGLALGRPGARRWDALCRVVERASFDAEALEVALARWPAALRSMPLRWQERWARGERRAHFALARRCEGDAWRLEAEVQLGDPFFAPFEHVRLYASLGEVARSIESGSLAQATHLILHANSSQRRFELLRTALAAVPPGRLRSLTLSVGIWGTDPDGDVARAIVAALGEHRLEALDLGAELDGAGFSIVAAAPALASLRELSLWRCALAGRAIAVLADAPWFAQLESLSLQHMRVGRAGVEALCARGWPPGLRRLVLDAAGLEPDGVPMAALAASLPPTLETLTLGGARLGREALRTLATAPVFEGLRELALTSMTSDEGALDELAAARWPRLETIDLRETPVASSAAVLSAAPWWCGLHSVLLVRSELDASALEILLGAGGFEQLEALALFGNLLGPAAGPTLQRLVAPRLRELDLGECMLGDEAVRALLGAPWVRGLERLDLASNELGEAAAAALRDAPFERLGDLELAFDPLGTGGVVALAGAAWLAALDHLGLEAVGVARPGVEALARRGGMDTTLVVYLRDNPVFVQRGESEPGSRVAFFGA